MPTRKNTEDYRLKKLARLVNNEHSIIDIGFAEYPNPYLQNPHVLGVDLDKLGKVPENYHKTMQGEIGPLTQEIGINSVDAIIAGEILEHLEEPIAFLRSCYSLIKPGGKIVLSTPNPHSPIEILLTIFLSRRWFYTRHHIMLFPQRWIIRMLEITGFQDVKIYSGGFPIPPFGLIPFPRTWCYQYIAEATKPS